MTQAHGGRHASWLELFFDLVVVAAVVQLAHTLHGDPGLGDIAIFAALYLAVWMAWTSFTLYANVAGDATQRRFMMLAMFGIAVMAASVPQATAARANIFAGAYILVRILATRTWARTRQMLVAWPSVQAGSGILPWIVSLFVPAPWKFVLWGVGLAADLLLPILLGGKEPDVRVPAWVQRRIDRQPDPARSQQRLLTRVARLDLPHLAERLGLLLIIVLGEAVMQLVNAAADTEWDAGLVTVATGGFLLLFLLWFPIFRWGFVASGGRDLPVRLVMPLHYTNTASLTAIAAGLGSLTAHSHGHVPAGVRWLLCGGVAVYFAAVVLGAVIMSSGWWHVLALAAITVALPVMLGLLGADLPAPVLTWLVVAIVAGQVAFALWDERRKSLAR
ncbi:MAG TPA: low temperature requirement protein A [Candidatus Limnocylindrales bacterium]